MEIRDRKVMVTGASRGLGRALALACARAGAAEVVAGARRPGTVDSLKEEAAAFGGRVRAVRLDVTSDAAVAEAARAAGRVDILINSAGTLAMGGVLKAELEAVKDEVAVNYLGILRVCRAFVPPMIEHGDGLVVNVASHLGKVSLPVIGTYCALKAALLSVSQSLRGDLAGTGVRVIAVLPGAIDTEMSKEFDIPKMAPEAAAQEILEAIQLEALETPIGDQARGTFASLAADPFETEKAFGRFRA